MDALNVGVATLFFDLVLEEKEAFSEKVWKDPEEVRK